MREHIFASHDITIRCIQKFYQSK